MSSRLILTLIIAAFALPGLARADELTKIVQQDLVTLGYDPGNTDGEATTQTIVAVSKFQAERGLQVTGEITPQLAGIIKAAINQAPPAAASSTASAAAAAPPPRDATALRAAQEACLQQKIADAQESQQKRRGLRSLARAVTRTVSELGDGETARRVNEVASDVYSAGAIASDVQSAARDLGITEDEIEQCRSAQ